MSMGRETMSERGFTLIELMIAMVMGLVILAGLTTVFVSYNKLGSSVASRTETMTDLYLVSFLMQQDLREAAAVTNPAFPADLQAGGRKPAGTCSAPNDQTVALPANYPASFPYLPYWDATSKTLTYQDQDGNTGIFQYQRTSNDRIYWLRPDPCSYQFLELTRDLNTTNGLSVTAPAPGVGSNISVTLIATYVDANRDTKNLSLGFTVWPRN